MIIAPSFGQAQLEFSAFARTQGLVAAPTWLLREDVAVFRSGFIVKKPLPADTLSLVTNFYEQARESRLGVLLCGLCRTKDTLYGHVWAPRTVADAEREHVPPAGL